MNSTHSRRTRVIYVAPRTWLGKLAAVLTGIVLIILAVFFFAVFLAVFSVLAVVMIARVLWLSRQPERGGPDDILEGEFSVEPGAEPRDGNGSARAGHLEQRRDNGAGPH